MELARLLCFGQDFERQRIDDARVGAAAVVVDRSQVGQDAGVELFDGNPVVAVERRVEALQQKQVAVAVNRQTGVIFAAAVEQPVGIGVFGVQAFEERLARVEGGLQQGGELRRGHGFSGRIAAIGAQIAAGKPRRCILPDGVVHRGIKKRPQSPMAASRAGAPLGTGPAAVIARPGAGFILDQHAGRGVARLARAAPVLATGAAFAVDGVAQQFFALRQAAMLCVAGTTAPPLASQPLMPLFTL